MKALDNNTVKHFSRGQSHKLVIFRSFQIKFLVFFLIIELDKNGTIENQEGTRSQ